MTIESEPSFTLDQSDTGEFGMQTGNQTGTSDVKEMASGDRRDPAVGQGDRRLSSRCRARGSFAR